MIHPRGSSRIIRSVAAISLASATVSCSSATFVSSASSRLSWASVLAGSSDERRAAFADGAIDHREILPQHGARVRIEIGILCVDDLLQSGDRLLVMLFGGIAVPASGACTTAVCGAAPRLLPGEPCSAPRGEARATRRLQDWHPRGKVSPRLLVPTTASACFLLYG